MMTDVGGGTQGCSAEQTACPHGHDARPCFAGWQGVKGGCTGAWGWGEERWYDVLHAESLGWDVLFVKYFSIVFVVVRQR